MRPIIHHVRRKAHKHRTFLLTILAVLALGIAANFINGLYTQEVVLNSFKKNHEKQAADQLKSYSFGLQSLLETRFTNQLDTLSKIVNDSSNKQAITSKNYSTLEPVLRNLINTDSRFDIVYILDQKGIATLVVNKENDTKTLGTDFSYRDYFRVPLSTKQPYVGYAFKTLRNNNILPFSIPVIDAGGNVAAVISASSTLQSLAESIKLPAQLEGLYFALVDSKGNLLLSEDQPPESIASIKDKDSVVALLLAGVSDPLKSEVNYLNDKTFARGKTLSVGGNKFYIISYYQQSKYEHDLAVVKSDYRRALFTSGMRSLLLFIAGTIVVFWIIKHHEETIKE